MDKNLDLEYMELAKACGVDGSDWHNEILEFAYQVAKHERKRLSQPEPNTVLANRKTMQMLVESIEKIYASTPPYRENGECTIPDHVVNFANAALVKAREKNA